MINWKTTKEEMLTITMIVDRLMEQKRDTGAWQRVSPISIHMDLSACHCNGCPLDLKGLLAASNADFTHDVLGIMLNINRDNAHLDNCFTPRYAAQKVVVA